MLGGQPLHGHLHHAFGQCSPVRLGQCLWVSIQADDVAEGRRVFDALAQGGQVTMPFDKTFWSAGFGMVTDRFGTPWMVNVNAG